MKMVSILMLVLLLASATAMGCINPPQASTPTPTATPLPTVMPTYTPTPVPSLPATSQVFMPEQTTNGRTYSNATVTPIPNSSRPGGQAGGELGRQP